MKNQWEANENGVTLHDYLFIVKNYASKTNSENLKKADTF